MLQNEMVETIKARGGRVMPEDALRAAGQLGASLIDGDYSDCEGGLCPLEAIAKVCGVDHAEALWQRMPLDIDNGADQTILPHAYAIGYIRAYDGMGDEYPAGSSIKTDVVTHLGFNPETYALGRGDGELMRRVREQLPYVEED